MGTVSFLNSFPFSPIINFRQDCRKSCAHNAIHII